MARRHSMSTFATACLHPLRSAFQGAICSTFEAERAISLEELVVLTHTGPSGGVTGTPWPQLMPSTQVPEASAHPLRNCLTSRVARTLQVHKQPGSPWCPDMLSLEPKIRALMRRIEPAIAKTKTWFAWATQQAARPGAAKLTDCTQVQVPKHAQCPKQPCTLLAAHG